jgi:hypothetical protein
MKVRQRDRAQLLGQVPLFSYCSQHELAKVAKLEALAERLAPSTT